MEMGRRDGLKSPWEEGSQVWDWVEWGAVRGRDGSWGGHRQVRTLFEVEPPEVVHLSLI